MTTQAPGPVERSHSHVTVPAVTPSGSVTAAVSAVSQPGNGRGQGQRPPPRPRSVTVTVTSLVRLEIPSDAATVTEYVLSVPTSDGDS